MVSQNAPSSRGARSLGDTPAPPGLGSPHGTTHNSPAHPPPKLLLTFSTSSRKVSVRSRGGWVGSRVILCSVISSSIMAMKAFCPAKSLAASLGMRRSTGTKFNTCAGHTCGALCGLSCSQVFRLTGQVPAASTV